MKILSIIFAVSFGVFSMSAIIKAVQVAQLVGPDSYVIGIKYLSAAVVLSVLAMWSSYGTLLTKD